MKKFSLDSSSSFFTGTLARMADCFTILSICGAGSELIPSTTAGDGAIGSRYLLVLPCVVYKKPVTKRHLGWSAIGLLSVCPGHRRLAKQQRGHSEVAGG